MRSGLPVHEIFALRAAETPGALAVAGPGLRLTYGELELRAHRLARHLRSLGIGPEVPVAVLAGRSPEALVAILAVLKAGGCYLPLDPAYPEERLAWILADSGASVLLTQGPVPAVASVRVVLLEKDVPETEGAPELPRVGLGHLAYVIYTSGSTGRPKGVEVEHRGLANLAAWHRRTYGITPAVRATRLAGPAFDASIWEVWPYLTAGASLHIPEEEAVLSPDLLAEWLVREGITHAFLPTPLAEAVLAEPWPADAPLAALLTGGDRLHRRPRPDHPFGLFNHYGPTESSVVTTWSRVEAEGDGVPAIGRPIDGIEVLLNEAGEILIGGVGLARGYRGRPDLTAERFVPSPGGKRLYRTGDLARLLPSGELEFIGRSDFQVKVRGFRIELGEIEAVLRRHPAVREGVVLARDGEGVEKRLVGYVVAQATAAELGAWLSRELPGYMVPASWIFLDVLPLTPNGKVDRAALPAPERAEEDAYVAPRTETEERLAAIFAEVLELSRVGARDDFFALGGHSLKVARVLSRVRRDLRVDLPPRDLFDHPTVEGLAQRVLATRGEAAEEWEILPVPRPEGPEAELPVSFPQRSLWLADHLSPGTALFNTPFALSLAGPLDTPALARALDEIVRRHEPLRTTFRSGSGGPVQVVHRTALVPLPIVDLSGLPGPARARKAEQIAAVEARHPFDLRQGPMLRLRLLRLGEAEHTLLALMHHIVSDDWSVWVFVSELAALYAAFTRSLPSPLPELPVGYGDFALWQRRWLEGEALGQLAWWQERLRPPLPVLDLPADRPRPAVRSSRGARLRRPLPDDLVQGLGALGRAADASLFIALLAGFDALLFRYTGVPEVLVGSPIANRHRVEVEGLIGVFVNTLALPADLSGDPRFGELLGRVRETLLGAYAHQDLPFDRLVEELAPVRDLSRSPLVDVFLILGNAPRPPRELAPGVRLSLLELEADIAKADLSLFLEEAEEGMLGLWEHSTDLFDATTVARMAGHLEALLAGAAADPGARISDLPLLSRAERAELSFWNTSVPKAAEATVRDLFHAQVARTPEAPAVVAPDGVLTYAGLHGRALRLAARLAALGVGPEVPVGVFCDRTPGLPVAFAAVLAAGGVYVPIDPSLPAERIAFLLADSGCPVVLAEGALPESATEGVRVLPLDPGPGEEVEVPFVPPALDPGNLAYLIYTSGSTGRPKGVGVSHGVAAAHAVGAGRAFGLGPGDRMLLFASPGFDVSVEDLLTSLLSGAAVVPRGAALPAPVEMTRRIDAQEVTVVNLPPAYWAEWLRSLEGAGSAPAALRLMIVGGDEMPPEAVRLLHRTPLRHVRLLNGYGPTEAVVTATLEDVKEVPTGLVPIGRPLPGRSAWVLDRKASPLPVGVPGELALGGLLARGYLGQPALTAEKFVPDPFSGHPGERLYRTGDLARQRPDGAIEFLGRVDHQVKIRGFRIEPGEVEVALLRHPGVVAAAVVVTAHGGEKRLAAYAVPREGESLETGELRAFLAGRLPAYMVPAVFVVLSALPLSPSGKVDRRALPAPEGEEPRDDRIAPRTPAEELLADAWAELLGIARPGVHDDFFLLGGHSLLATRLLFRIRELFGVELPLRAVFESPTVAALAARVEAERLAAAGLQAPPVLPRGKDEALPLSFAQQRLWFLERLRPGTAAYNLPSVFRLQGPLAVPALAAALGEIVRRHDVLRTTFAIVAGEPVQVVEPPGPRPLPVVDLSALPVRAGEGEAARLAWEEVRRPFDLRRGPLLRETLVRLGAEEHRLLLTVHHIAADGWSLDVLLHELGVLYRAGLDARPSPLPELHVQYADFALWQRRWLAGDVLDAQLAYWREALSGCPLTLDLPADRPRPPVRSPRGALAERRMPAELGQRLEALGRGRGATFFMTLLAAFGALLHRYTGAPDVLVGTPVAGRSPAETAPLLGFFVNTLVMRTGFAADPTFDRLLVRTRETALAAYAHQDLPFERLVEELSPERDLSRSPIVQVSFAVERPLAEGGELAPGLSLASEDVELGIAKFDLFLGLVPGPDALLGCVEYATDLFDAATVQRMLGHLEVLLAAAAADPGARISGLPLLTAAEREHLLGWQEETRHDHPSGDLLHGLFAAQAFRTPEKIALIAGDERLTYAELARRASSLADRLGALGVGPETPVGLCLERNADLVVAMLGVLAAGGFYVPLDPAYPAERLAFLLADSGCRVILAHARVTDRLPPHEARVILLQGDDAPQAARPRTLAPTPGNLAYLIYTSGSTGRPKAVAIEHRSAVLLAHWAKGVFGPEELSGMLASTSITFDLSVFEIFVPLAWGGTVILAENALALPKLPARDEVRTINTVPSAIAELLRMDALPPSLTTINLAGEALTRALADRVYARQETRRLYNLYGPSEDTTYSTFARIERESERQPAIGRPVDGTEGHVADARLHLLPVGVPGELLLSGDSLARGYLGRPELTAERFLPDPWSGRTGARLYRTGDLVRRRLDGALDFLGRIDHQVKVRGFRIELGEIESALLAQPGVQAAVVMTGEDAAGGTRLVAYVASSGQEATAQGLRLALQKRLPEPMVPSAFVLLDRMPLTPNGKVDRKALPAPERSRTDDGFLSPRTPLEAEVAGIWGDILGVDRVGLQDGFFDLGGHSLLATRVLARIEEAFGVDMPLQSLFESPTLEGFTAALGRKAVESMGEVEGFLEKELALLLQEESRADAPIVPVAEPAPTNSAWSRTTFPAGHSSKGFN
jgi:amino acid adenylation domain-containing protein